MKVAVTGGSGFIGSHVVDKLVAAGHHVIIIDSGRPPGRTDAAYRDADIRDLSALVRATSGCDVIFHLAGVSNVNDAMADPVTCMEVNVVGTARICEAARRNQIGRTVLASTVWVYAAAAGQGIATEDTPLFTSGTEHVYTSSKLAAELVVTSFGELYGLHYTILRYGIPFGPRMRDELVIPRFVRRALQQEKLTIYGDGLQFRNYVYVEDLAEAHLAVLGDGAVDQIINLEGREPVSIRRAAEVIRELINPLLPIEFVPARPGDYAGREVSAGKAKQLLAWEARTSFEDGMRRYLDWWLMKAESDEAESDEAQASQG